MNERLSAFDDVFCLSSALTLDSHDLHRTTFRLVTIASKRDFLFNLGLCKTILTRSCARSAGERSRNANKMRIVERYQRNAVRLCVINFMHNNYFIVKWEKLHLALDLASWLECKWFSNPASMRRVLGLQNTKPQLRRGFAPSRRSPKHQTVRISNLSRLFCSFQNAIKATWSVTTRTQAAPTKFMPKKI